MDQRGQTAFVIPFLIIAVLTLILYAFVSPTLIYFNTTILSTADTIIEDSNQLAQDITNPEIRAGVQGSLATAQGSVQTNIDINAQFFTYGWIILIAVITLYYFLFMRKQVEQEQQLY